MLLLGEVPQGSDWAVGKSASDTESGGLRFSLEALGVARDKIHVGSWYWQVNHAIGRDDLGSGTLE